MDVERWASSDNAFHGGRLDGYGARFVVDLAERAAVALLFDDPAGYVVSPHALLESILWQNTVRLARSVRMRRMWRATLGITATGLS
jgi:hypothetical protein